MGLLISNLYQDKNQYFTIKIIIPLLLIVLSTPLKAETNHSEKQNILVLHSYHQKFKWTNNITRGIEDILGDNFEIQIHYMDSKRQYDEQYKHLLFETIKYKHNKHNYDLIICSDNNAFKFLKEYNNKIFGNIPVVFCGVNFLTEKDITGLENFTGINEQIDLDQNIRLIKNIHPGKNKLVCITDNTPTGKRLRTELEKSRKKFHSDFNQINIYSKIRMSALLDTLKTLSDNSIVFYTLFFRDKNNDFYNYKESARMITSASSVPVYGTWDFSLGHGIVGGYLVSGYQQGRAAAQKAKKILGGTPVKNISIKWKNQNRPLFDNKLLSEYNISKSDLPKNSKIVNRPHSLFREHTTIFWIVIISVGILTILIVALTFNIISRHKTEKELRKSHENLKVTLNSIGEGVIVTDKKGQVIRMNPVAEKLTGWTQEKAKDKSLESILTLKNTQTNEKVSSPVETVIEKGKIVGMGNHTTLVSQEGEKYHIADSGAPIRNKEGKIIGVVLVFRDITEKYQKNQKIAKNEAYLKAIFNSISSGLSVVDRNLCIEYVNPTISEAFSDRKELLGNKCFKCFREQDSPCSPCPTIKCFETGETETNIVQGPPHSEVDTVELSAHPIRDPDSNEIVGAVEFSRDITDKIEAKRKIDKSHEFIQNVINSLTDIFYVIDKNKNFVMYNRALKEISGYTENELDNMQPKDFFPKEERKKIAKGIEEAFNSGFVNVEGNLKTKDGREIPYNFSATLTKDLEEKPIICGVGQNISKRIEAQKALKKTKNYIDNIVNSMPSAIISIDKNRRITQWNNQAEEKTKIKTKDALGQKIDELCPELIEDKHYLQTAIQEKEVRKIRERQRTVNSQTIYEDIVIYPLKNSSNGSTRIEGAVIRIDDRTEQKKMEQMMIQSEKMVSVGGLAAGMAHEINNPLAGMIQNVSVILNRLTNKDMPANQKAAQECNTDMEAIHNFMKKRDIIEQLKMINESGQRAAEIVKNMLNFVREGKTKKRPVSIPGLIDKTIELAQNDYNLKKKYDFRKTEIEKNYDKNLPRIHCEKNEIQQVLLNILKNGAQAMQKERAKNSSVEPPKFIINVTSNENRVQIDISDNGPGISQKIQNRIFEPFFTTKDVDKGTGLGLSVSYFIITEEHNGKMYVDSELGEGSTFSIILPINNSET